MIIQKMSDGTCRVKDADVRSEYRTLKGGTPQAAEWQKKVLIEVKKELKKLEQKAVASSKSLQAKKSNMADMLRVLSDLQDITRSM